MFQYHTLQTVNDLIYQSWCVPWCQILLNPEGLFHFTKHYSWIKALQMQPEVWLLLLMIYINIKARLKPKCFCIIERKQNVWCTRICFIFSTSIFVIVSRKYFFASLFHFLVEMQNLAMPMWWLGITWGCAILSYNLRCEWWWSGKCFCCEHFLLMTYQWNLCWS